MDTGRINQEGADHIEQLVRNICGSIDSKLTSKQIEKIAEELNALMSLTIDIQDKWDKV